MQRLPLALVQSRASSRTSVETHDSATARLSRDRRHEARRPKAIVQIHPFPHSGYRAVAGPLLFWSRSPVAAVRSCRLDGCRCRLISRVCQVRRLSRRKNAEGVLQRVFARRYSSTGPTGAWVAYVTAGVNTCPFTCDATNGSGAFGTAVQVIDLSTVNSIEGVSSVYFTITFAGFNAGSYGTARIDNVLVEGTAIPTPAAASLLALVGLAAARRRRRISRLPCCFSRNARRSPGVVLSQ